MIQSALSPLHALSGAQKAVRRVTLATLLAASTCTGLFAQPPGEKKVKAPWEIEPTEATIKKVDDLIEAELAPEITMYIDPSKSKLIRTKRPVSRFSITNPSILDIVQFSPTEFEFIGLQAGQTTLTLWYPGEGDEPEIIRYLVRVQPDDTIAAEYGQLQDRVNELFPCSVVQLVPVADKLVVRGQAKDAQEAARILAILGGQQTTQSGGLIGPGSFLNVGTAALPYLTDQETPAANLINLLEVPGEQQIMLRVRVAELSRTAIRSMGSNFQVRAGDFSFDALFGGLDGPTTAVLAGNDVTLALSVLSANSYGKLLAEPNLVTLNGRPASFLSGGEFAVPTVVGVAGVGAVSTDFRSFGTQLTFTPQLIEKDRIRLIVSPSFSTVNQGNTVNGIPGLNSRSVNTTVDLREGQWLAIGGLLQDTQAGSRNRTPILGDIPVVNMFFSQKDITRAETELIFFVSPELIHPLEAEEAPLILPGMEVTEPCDWDFYIMGNYEGRQGYHHRSTVWPVQKERIWRAKWEAWKEARRMAKYQPCESYYIYGDHGFSY